MSKKYKVIALMGKSASGKDTILKAVCDKFPNLHKKVSTTTREPRENEVDGVDYFFTNPTDFAQKIIDGDMLEASSFNDWFYGTEKKSFDENKINIGVFNPDGIRALLDDGNVDLEVVYVICPNKTRIIRSLERETNPDIEEVFRRYKTDESDFGDLDFDFSVVLNDGRFTIDELVEQVRKIIVLKMGKKI